MADRDWKMKKVADSCMTAAKHFHQGQMYGDEPYINHCLRVASNFGNLSIGYQIALLHDVLEDTDATEEILLKDWEIPPGIVKGVRYLTREPNTPYKKYISNICRSGIVYIKIKLSDIEDHLKHNPKPSLKQRYIEAQRVLQLSFDVKYTKLHKE